MFIGNPFTDVPNSRRYPGGGDARAGGKEALRSRVNSGVSGTAAKTHEPRRASIAMETKGHVVLVDAADAPVRGLQRQQPSSGAAGRGLRRTALMPIVDEPAVRAAFAAGVGGYMKRHQRQDRSRDSSRSDLVHGPTPLRRMVSQRIARQKWFSGNTAVLETGPFTIVATSLPATCGTGLCFCSGQRTSIWWW
jgi:microcystin degradation protein MlrC